MSVPVIVTENSDLTKNYYIAGLPASNIAKIPKNETTTEVVLLNANSNEEFKIKEINPQTETPVFTMQCTSQLKLTFPPGPVSAFV